MSISNEVKNITVLLRTYSALLLHISTQKNITVLLRIYSALLLHISTQKNIFLEEEVALLKE